MVRWFSWKEPRPCPLPGKYPLELRERAVAMYRAAEPKPVIRQMARYLGVHHEALRNWIRQDQADRGELTDRPTTAEKEELARLRKEKTELRRANEVLRVARLFSRSRSSAAVPGPCAAAGPVPHARRWSARRRAPRPGRPSPA